MSELFTAVLGKPFGVVVYQLLAATQYTIYLSLIALIGGGLIALVITIVRTSPYLNAKRVAAGYIWLFQSVPLLMLLFLIGLGIPRILGVNVNPWLAASIALVVYASAYLADVWRGAVESIPAGQWEGARALGLSFLKIVRLVILPQAVRISLAPTVGFTVQIIKGTSLAYIIGFYDLMSIGKRWANAPVSGTEPYVIFPLMALIYFCLCFPLSVWARRLERRLGAVSSKQIPKLP
ncbi:amine acid ABC transporter, permease protein, 3-TM region, His/Glu/Gln/Arg/opine family [Hoeflea phototrophica DFL-43]|uniref:Amine acid ABC transporter, permease protein, 3-TM region, His/Glu/Gln/Arg/opine family n=1 Tax=Hoeflea phototrophica (strain DSM 17068 / NCIMB 14078 / DFL-43) TaxID=411684 RepID=A9D3N7_HOEPD|nr:amino acid ABC transporter permease [Hoeflea phototrophica]EDQ33707.1 amine acid ABC transporter, permease protein, 3-TM region, His/Glu/Gln/Arg/opine family [Hoeflea phototrophica DFL-43]